MKNEIILILLGILLSQNNLWGNGRDTILVSLEAKDSTLSAYLVFENSYSDTVAVLNRFKNHYQEWESSSGIRIQPYINGQPFDPFLGLSDYFVNEYFHFGKKQVIFINPKGKIKFLIDLSDYFWKCQNIDREIGVVFEINFVYILYHKAGQHPISIRTTTNYVKVMPR